MQSSWLPDTAESLSAGFPEDMVILDCETTGGNAKYHRIIELGLIVIHKGEVVEQWQSFVNPEQTLPAKIQSLTGIRPSDVSHAPIFADIAETVLEKLQNRVLVAHFARFDYGFLKNEFSRLGISYSSKPLCSVKLSRALFPQFKRHGLDAIIKRFNLTIENRHRAYDDAAMVHQFFLKISALFDEDEVRANCLSLQKRPALPVKLAESVIDTLPNQPGVYYFYDDKGQILYIGKSVNLRNRVLSHFTQDYRNPKDLTLSQKVADISFEQTAGDFSAQLLESQAIKAQSPLYNRRLKKVKKLFQLELVKNNDGANHIAIKAVDSDISNAEQFGLFRTQKQAQSLLRKLADDYFLCLKLVGLEGRIDSAKTKPCFRFQLKKCLGACCGNEAIGTHNERLAQALTKYQLKVWPYTSGIVIEEHNADTEQRAFHLIDQWRYITELQDANDVYDHGYSPARHSTTQNATLDASFSEQNNDLATKPGPLEALEFDLDTYFILVRFLLANDGLKNITVHRLVRVDG